MTRKKNAPGSNEGNPLQSALIWCQLSFGTLTVYLLGLIFHLWKSIYSKHEMNCGFHDLSRYWGKANLGLVPSWSLHIEGLENIDRKQHYVIVANHQSILDIVLLLASLPIQFRFMAKKELYSIPVLGWHITLAGYIPVDRNHPHSRRDALLAARAVLKNKASMVMFVEGTRSRDGEIHEFKPGAFRLAQKDRVPILPVVLDGTGIAIPKNTWMVRPNLSFHVRVQKPMLIAPEEDIDAVVTQVRNNMIQTLADIRRSETQA